MSSPTAYQRVGNVGSNPTDYDWQSFPMFMKFDGVDDSLATSAIDFSGTDKVTAFAGIRSNKVPDANIAMLMELSAALGSNNGAFFFTAPSSTANFFRFGWNTKGTVAASGGSTSSTYDGPYTAVISGTGDISGDLAVMNINRTEVSRLTTDQGTGNYGNYPLYIGARAGNQFWFIGRLYSLIVRGAASSAAQINSAEKWVNTKTGAY